MLVASLANIANVESMKTTLLALTMFLFTTAAHAQEGGSDKSFFFTAGADYISGDPVDMEADDGKGISAGVMMAGNHSWGFRSFITYEFERDVQSIGGILGILSIDAHGDKVQFHVLQADALYRWGAFYLPFGLHYMYPQYHATAGRKVDFSGGLGTQGGVGWLINDLITLDIITRFTIMESKVTQPSSSYSSDGSGSMFSLVFRAGFAF